MRSAEITILRAVGDIDMMTTPDIHARLVAAVAQYRHVVLDFAAVQFFGSAGLKLLVDVDRIARANGSALHVAGVQQASVLRPIQLSGIDTLLSLTDRPADAVADELAAPAAEA